MYFLAVYCIDYVDITGRSSARRRQTRVVWENKLIFQQNASGIRSKLLLMIRAHSFPWKILPNSMGQLTKFRGSLWQNRPNSAARHTASHLWLKTERAVQKLQLLKAGIVLSYVRNRKGNHFFQNVQWNLWRESTEMSDWLVFTRKPS